MMVAACAGVAGGHRALTEYEIVCFSHDAIELPTNHLRQLKRSLRDY